ncbi:Planctomycete cytochrome C [Anatilimnocola aggregata]|uniref:Planctomycete cytochrome C n=1 Tax=Anatilimnocola aggregata TaxID=2528021 RepID=A0A517Y8N2_9BACT|nr:Planctomycete cytochrome C [Anatilimnocola aggregata]
MFGFWIVTFASVASTDEGTDFFEAKIRPVLVEHCYACHSADAALQKKLKGGLLLDTREGIRKGGESGPAVVPDKVDESALIAAIRHESFKMPPKGKLPEAVIADFVKWIELGAPDPRDGTSVVQTEKIDWQKAREFWAFQKPKAHAPPRVKNALWPRKEMDHFVLAELEKRGLTPVRAATKHEWIRRATFDLIGLPPTPEEVDAFEKDESPEVLAKVVDRLLESPHYGERWGRYWLDLARYTDDLGGTVGPVLAPTAFRYRDWVVQAFNRDMPYDQFVRLQLAGNLIREPAKDFTERLGGLGFQGLGQRFSGNAVGMVKKKVADELDDRVDTVTRALLGLTVSCARCHDHKFDPIPTVDYYSLAAAYNGANLSAEIALASPAQVAAEAQRKKEAAELQAKMDKLTADEGRRLGRQELARLDEYLLAAWKLHVRAERKQPADAEAVARESNLNSFFLVRWTKALANPKGIPLLEAWHAAALKASETAAMNDPVEPPQELRDASAKAKSKADDALRALSESEGAKSKLPPAAESFIKAHLSNDGAAFQLRGKDAIAYLSAADRLQYDEWDAKLQRLQASAPAAVARAPAVIGGGQPLQINVRGNADVLGPVATPGFLTILRRDSSASATSLSRLELADAIVDRNNPLTARVFVNRVWHYHFGRGIVGTTSNFGQLGDRPTHPELLDTLAVRFMENGWSTKWLHREIMLSATYGLSSVPEAKNLAKDADNHYLWRVSPRRLDFEAWRDSMLAVAGKLDPEIGGQPYRDPQGKVQLHPEDPENRRRTIYGFISRFKPNPTLTLFDFPEPNVTSDQRTVTTIPQQQLFAINSPFVLAMARSFAERLNASEQSEERRLLLAWQLAFGRLTTERETVVAQEFLREAAASEEKLGPWERLCHSLLTTNEFTFVP